MRIQELIKSTKLIAQYDGWELKGDPDFTAPYQCFEKYIEGKKRTIPFINPDGVVYDAFLNSMKYHTSWDWIMPVIIKIEDGSIKDVQIYSEVCMINYPHYKKKILGCDETKLLACFDAASKYIEWENSLPK